MDSEQLEKELEKFKPNIEGKSIDELPSYEVFYFNLIIDFFRNFIMIIKKFKKKFDFS